jgi:hypothetical protein
MSVRRPLAPRLLVAAVATAAALVSSIAAGQAPQERFTGFAVNLNGGPSTGTVDFTIERWSTDAERDALLSILKEEKDPYRANDKLLKALQKMPVAGRLLTPQRLGWDLRYAYQTPLEGGGRRIVLGTDRPVGFGETVTQARTMDYPFTIIEMRLDKDDRGEGKILAGTRLLIDRNNQLVLENYAQQPVRFNQIHRQK